MQTFIAAALHYGGHTEWEAVAVVLVVAALALPSRLVPDCCNARLWLYKGLLEGSVLLLPPLCWLLVFGTRSHAAWSYSISTVSSDVDNGTILQGERGGVVGGDRDIAADVSAARVTRTGQSRLLIE